MSIIYPSSTTAKVEQGYLMYSSSNNVIMPSQQDFSLDVSQFTDKTIQALKTALGYGDAIVKCTHCGQWGAMKTSCKHCGAPVG